MKYKYTMTNEDIENGQTIVFSPNAQKMMDAIADKIMGSGTVAMIMISKCDDDGSEN